MDRLTKWKRPDLVLVSNSVSFQEILYRLADYENTGYTPAEINELALKVATLETIEAMYDGLGNPDHLRDLIHAEKDGRLVVLPCKVGDTVYRLCGPKGRKYVAERLVTNVSLCGNNSWRVLSTTEDWLGKTVFLTREEAEAALKGLIM